MRGNFRIAKLASSSSSAVRLPDSSQITNSTRISELIVAMNAATISKVAGTAELSPSSDSIAESGIGRICYLLSFYNCELGQRMLTGRSPTEKVKHLDLSNNQRIRNKQSVTSERITFGTQSSG